MISRDIERIYGVFGVFCICGSGCWLHLIGHLALEHFIIYLLTEVCIS